MDRLLHLEQQGPNMLAILALCYVIFIFFAPKSSFIQSCNSISSKFRVLRIWLSINVFISFIIIPVYALEFCYARTQRNNEAIEKARDLQDEANEQIQLQNEMTLALQTHADNIVRERLIRYRSKHQPQSGFTAKRIRMFVEQQLKTINFEKSFGKSQNEEEIETCGICLLEFDELEKIKFLDCKIQQSKDDSEQNVQGRHLFHFDCILNWFHKKVECPLCRYSFTNQVKSAKKKTEFELELDLELLKKDESEARERIKIRD